MSVNTMIMLMIMKAAKSSRNRNETEISTNELRMDFDRVLRAIKQGRSLTLTYRRQPLARIIPLEAERKLREDDPIYHMSELAEPVGEAISNEEIDRLIYGS